MKTKRLNRILVLFFTLFLSNKATSQSGIYAKNFAPASNAMLDVISTQTILPIVIVTNTTS